MKAESLIIQKNIRPTAFRSAVLNVFLQHRTAITVEQIEQELGPHDRVTLYRTLKSFLDKGVIHEIVNTQGGRHLAVCKESCAHHTENHGHEHIHFECHKCKQIFCLEVSSFPQVKVPNFNIEQIEISAKGICAECGKA